MDCRIVYLGDMHIGRHDAGDEEFEDDVVQHVVRKVLEWYGPDAARTAVVLAGDIVNDGKPEQMCTATRLLRPLSEVFTYVPIPGNHDYGWNGMRPKMNGGRTFNSHFYPGGAVTYPYVVPLPGGHTLINLNSMAAEHMGWWDVGANGDLGRRQRKKLKRELATVAPGRPDKKVLVNLHHHPFIFPGSGVKAPFDKFGHNLNDAAKFRSTVTGQADVLMFGHEHEHRDFTGTTIADKFQIPVVLGAGKITDKQSVQYAVDAKGKPTKQVLHRGVMGFEILLGGGDIKHRTIEF